MEVDDQPQQPDPITVDVDVQHSGGKSRIQFGVLFVTFIS
jgi:hypothetical protein